MLAVDVVRKARALIEAPEHWTRGATVRKNEDGSFCYCLTGALWVAAGGTVIPAEYSQSGWTVDEFDSPVEDHALQEAYDTVRNVVRDELLASWNDSEDTQHADVIEALKETERWLTDAVQ